MVFSAWWEQIVLGREQKSNMLGIERNSLLRYRFYIFGP